MHTTYHKPTILGVGPIPPRSAPLDKQPNTTGRPPFNVTTAPTEPRSGVHRAWNHHAATSLGKEARGIIPTEKQKPGNGFCPCGQFITEVWGTLTGRHPTYSLGDGTSKHSGDAITRRLTG
ncbi:hypothetical protein WOLCODRAFT_158003 [Wolfiporia cocos MD-104 SS10]|uniref:Uncharacterized protein n=1 Tax=Wolfiporia cocos (strain MD-104) TaxID=742152 RepID=A0A2H3JKW3_WOLCO|nr:hypothetical protein WOLCODRAFT_158003 [Wolfiporia cocos MD-104 SS10]